MSLDPKYIIAPALEQYYVDKDTGLPLSNGTLEFFSDVNRADHKPIYTISGSAPNYTYTELPNPLPLSAVGTPEDEAGNNIIPYYYPYDEDGNVELYYVVCKSEDDVEQFTREAWPNFAGPGADTQADNTFNYVPNGQFLLYENIPYDPINNIPAGKIRQGGTIVAYGGWQFLRDNDSTATDYVQVIPIPGYVSSPTSSPAHTMRIQCLGADISDTVKTLLVEFPDVNKFSSDTDYYTFAFNGITYSSANFDVQIFIGKNYGTGGSPSPQTATLITTFTITGAQTLFQIPFVFGANTGTQIGTDNNSVVDIQLRFPTNISFGGEFTDFMLVKGDVLLTEFPPQTNRDMIGRTLHNANPNPDGYSIGLPCILGPNGQGMQYDDSQVGKVFASIDELPAWTELSTDGATYRSDAYSPYGIPYRRLRNKLVRTNGAIDPYNLPKFGTGANYVTAYANAPFTGITLRTNKYGAQTGISNFGTPFIFYSNMTGSNTSYPLFATNFGSPNPDNSYIWVKCLEIGNVPENGPGDSGVLISLIPYPVSGAHIGNQVVRQIIAIGIDDTNTIAAGTYFNLHTPTTRFVVWFKVDGAGSQPSAGTATYIPVNILSTSNPYQISYLVAAALNGFQCDSIQIASGSEVTQGTYFTFHANGQLYYVWYTVTGAGEPSVPGGIGIEVPYLTSYSASDMAYVTAYYINDVYFGVPDFRGKMIKGWTTDSTLDENYELRYSNTPGVLPFGIGSYQFDYGLSYNRDVDPIPGIAPQITVDDNAVEEVTPDILKYTGTSQNDVKNAYLNFVIKY